MSNSAEPVRLVPRGLGADASDSGTSDDGTRSATPQDETSQAATSQPVKASEPAKRTIRPDNDADWSEGGFDRGSTRQKAEVPASEALEAEPPVPSRAARTRDALATFGRGVVQLVLTFAILVGAGVATVRIVADKPERGSRPPFSTTYTIATVTAVRGDHRPTFVAYGQTAAARTVDLRSLVGGEIVAVSPNLRAGARVAAGEALVTIDRFVYEGALAEARAGLAEAQARLTENQARIDAERTKLGPMREQLRLAEADVARAARLRRRGQLTQQQLEARQLVASQRRQALTLGDETIKIEQARLEQQRAGLPRLQFAVQKAERDLDSTVLKAPFDGVVRTAAAEIGRLVSANDVVVSLYEEGRIEARFTLTDGAFGRLQASDEGLIGRAVTARWTVGGRTYDYPGTVGRLGADITSNRGGVEVFADLTQPDGAPDLRPGAFIEIEVPDTRYAGTFALPDTALFDDKVYVVEDGVLAERTVEVAAFDGDRVLVSSGLEGGERVLITRITEVSAGLKVREEGVAPDVTPRPVKTVPVPGTPVAEGAPRGRPDREEVAKIAAANNLTLTAFRSLEPAERRAMVRKFRQGASK